MRFCLLFGAACAIAAAQPAAPSLQFEVASVKPDGQVSRPGPGNIKGGPGTADPTRIMYNFATLKLLVMVAYDLQDFQVSGPNWITSERYTIAATMSPGTTKEQLQAMLRNLLEERFKLKLHHETKVLPVYELTVGKGGLKMKESPDGATPMTAADYAEQKYVDGIPQFPAGRIGIVIGAGPGVVMVSAAHQPVSVLVKQLQVRVRVSIDDTTAVIDKTGLEGFYDFRLKFAPPAIQLLAANPNDGVSDPMPDVFTAVQQYLGLKLDSRKDPVDTVVIDEAEKIPVEN